MVEGLPQGRTEPLERLSAQLPHPLLRLALPLLLEPLLFVLPVLLLPRLADRVVQRNTTTVATATVTQARTGQLPQRQPIRTTTVLQTRATSPGRQPRPSQW